jgi:hypothetical protein
VGMKEGSLLEGQQEGMDGQHDIWQGPMWVGVSKDTQEGAGHYSLQQGFMIWVWLWNQQKAKHSASTQRHIKIRCTFILLNVFYLNTYIFLNVFIHHVTEFYYQQMFTSPRC